MTLKPPLELSVVARDPSGIETTWWSGAKPNDRASGLRFSTKRGEGFSEANVTLPRRVDRDWHDLGLLNDVTIVGDEGSIAWEGRLAGRPGSVDIGAHSISPSLVGWMSYARQRRFMEVYVDRDPRNWADAPLNEKIRNTAADINGAIQWASEKGGVACAIPNQAMPAAAQRAVAWYVAPPTVTIAFVMYIGATNSLPAGWTHDFRFSATDSLTSFVNVVPTLDGVLRTATPSPEQGRHVSAWLLSASTALTPAAGAKAYYTALAVVGNHGLTTRTLSATEANGVYLTDVMRDIATRFCPKLSIAGIEDNTHIVEQASFPEPTFPFDAWQQLNNFALWELGVWDNKTLTFAPADFTDYDWQVRLTDPGVSVSLTGDTVDDLYNGVQVTYDDMITGRREVLTPDTTTDLADTDPDNPVNQWGEDRWAEFDLPFPATSGDATQFGRVKLAEVLRPKGAGTINVQGHIRDRAGHWQPAWKVRAGDTIAIVDHPNDSPRLVVETDYTDDGRSLSIAVDSSFQELAAIMDQIQSAVGLANLG